MKNTKIFNLALLLLGAFFLILGTTLYGNLKTISFLLSSLFLIIWGYRVIIVPRK